jgi:hypothetical protein
MPSSPPVLSPCHQQARDLKAAIDARMLGRQVASFGQRGRSMAYSDVPLKDLIGYYNQIRAACPDAAADPTLIAIGPLDAPVVTRGPPARFLGRSFV